MLSLVKIKNRLMRTKQFKNLTALEIGEELKKVLGIDIYENTFFVKTNLCSNFIKG